MRLCARPEVNCSLTGNYSPFRACEKGCQTFWQNCTMGQPCTCKPHDEILCTCARMLSAYTCCVQGRPTASGRSGAVNIVLLSRFVCSPARLAKPGKHLRCRQIHTPARRQDLDGREQRVWEQRALRIYRANALTNLDLTVFPLVKCGKHSSLITHS